MVVVFLDRQPKRHCMENLKNWIYKISYIIYIGISFQGASKKGKGEWDIA